MNLSTTKAPKRQKLEAINTTRNSDFTNVIDEKLPSTTSTFTINDLPDDALIHVFECFPLYQILTNFRLVCTRWEGAVSSFCASRRTLKFFQAGDHATCFGRDVPLWPPAHYARLRLKPVGHDHDLVVREGKFSLDSCHLFHRLFPQIESLLIEDFGTVFPHLPTLLNGWPDLVTFSLHGFLPIGSAKKQQGNLYETLGRLSQLRHLDLLTNWLFGIRNSMKVMTPVLGRLEHFSALVRNTPIKDYFLSALSPSCTSLRLEDFPKVHLLETYLKPESFQAVTHLGVTDTKLSKEQLAFLCGAFPNVTDLTLSWGVVSNRFPLRFSHIVTQLSKLPSLTVLRLKLSYNFVREEVLCKSPSTCPTIRQLTLPVAMGVDDGKAIQSRSLYVFLASAFPNLEELSVYTTNCTKIVAEYEMERALRPRVLQYTESLWPQGQLRNLNVEEPLGEFGRHKEAYIAWQERWK